MKGFDVVHSGNYSFTEEELHKIKEAGIPVSFDFSDDSTEEYYEKTAPEVTYAFCSFDGTDQEAEEHLKRSSPWGRSLPWPPEEPGAAFFMTEGIFTDSRQRRLRK